MTRFMFVTGRGDDVWWPYRLVEWYDGWRRRRTLEVMVTVHDGDFRGTQQYYEWQGGHEPRPRQAASARGKLSLRHQRRRTRMLVVGAAAYLEEERAEEQREYDRQDELGQADGGEAFHDDHDDPETQWQQASPYQAGTSSHAEHGHAQAEPFRPQTQEHTGLDELFHMTSCPPTEFTRIVDTFRVSRAQHVDQGSPGSAAPPPPPPTASDVQHGPWIPTYSSPPVWGFPAFDPSRIGSEYAMPPSYHAPSSYHSHSFDRRSAPLPTMTQPQQSSTELDHPAADIPAPDPPLPPPTRRSHRATRPPPCVTGGHVHPRGDRQ
ncbi:hypothetical protein PIB30_031277 [Stylosanthes scabra]|uniref:Uncharacterized protein n=1 Tax=Stylosanthes scabra TaxID=79078 RepID=A0ABU6Y948_9FABA|nr:hypothetical protein [Stylosanthes scabra]